MKKPVYKLLDEKGRVLIPLEMRQKAEMEKGDVKLTEMHLDDWTIAKLLGHSNLKNVKYYRKMSNQILADDTRKARKRLSDIILQNLDGWGDEYEQIRQDGGM